MDFCCCPFINFIQPNVHELFSTDLAIEHSKLLEGSAKKRKLDQNSNSETAPAPNEVPRQEENFAAKTETLPESPLPMASFDPDAASYQSKATCETPVNEIPCGASNLDQSITVKPVTPSVNQQFGSLAKSEMKTDDNETSENVKSIPELMSKCKTIVERTMQKHAELTRSSFETVVLEILATQQIESRTIEVSLEKQRLQYDGVIATLRAKCNDLHLENVKLINQKNAEPTNTTHMVNMENELELSNGKIVMLHSKLNEMVNHNGVLNGKVTELQKLNAEISTKHQILHQKLHQTMSELQTATHEMASNGRDIREKCAELQTKFDGLNSDKTSELNRLRQQNQWQANRMLHMESTFVQKKNDAILETKQRQWCQGCGNPGDDPFYCNRCRFKSMQTQR